MIAAKIIYTSLSFKVVDFFYFRAFSDLNVSTPIQDPDLSLKTADPTAQATKEASKTRATILPSDFCYDFD